MVTTKMLSIEDLETLAHIAVEKAVKSGYLLISEEYGVEWDAVTKTWRWNDRVCQVKACDLIGAILMLMDEIPNFHGGDPMIAAPMVIDSSYTPHPKWEVRMAQPALVRMRNLAGGWDGTGHIEGDLEAYELGQRLAATYFPVPLEFVEVFQSDSENLKGEPEIVSSAMIS